MPEVSIKERNIEHDSNCIVFGRIGRLVDGKGNNNLIRSFAKLMACSKSKNMKLLFAGVGPNQSALEKLSAELEIEDNVIFSGLISQEAFFSNVNIMISPSLMEATPLVIAEALSCRVPVIATKVGGVPEMIEHERTGYLIEPNNIEELCNAMEIFLSDPDGFNRYAEQGYLIYKEKFSLEIMRNKIASLGLDFWEK